MSEMWQYTALWQDPDQRLHQGHTMRWLQVYTLAPIYLAHDNLLHVSVSEIYTAQPVNFVTPVKFVTCRKNAQE